MPLPNQHPPSYWMGEKPLVDSEGGPGRFAVTNGNRITSDGIIENALKSGNLWGNCFKKVIHYLLYFIRK